MVDQVGADLRQVAHHLDAMLAQMLGRADPRILQHVRRSERATRQDDLAPRPRRRKPRRRAIFEPDGATLREDQPGHVRLGDDLQGLAAARRVEEGARAAPAALAADRRLVIAGAFLLGAVEIGGERDARLLCRSHRRLANLRADTLIGDRERPADAVILVLAALLVLGLAEIGQDIVIAPADAALLPPQVIVAGVAAHIDHAVDRARSAEHLATRHIVAAVA